MKHMTSGVARLMNDLAEGGPGTLFEKPWNEEEDQYGVMQEDDVGITVANSETALVSLISTK